MKKIILTGGGTAGHVTPNIALLPALKAASYEITYIGSVQGIEQGLIEAEQIPYYGISSGKLRRYLDLKNISDPFKVIKGLAQSVSLLQKLKPDVIFSKGGFVTVPVVFAAKLLRIPVVIHESDITPGLANKLALPAAAAVCCNFPETLQYIPGNKAVLTGSPIRQELLSGDRSKALQFCGFMEGTPVLLVIGGSTGSRKINEVLRSLLPELTTKYQIIHLCGKGNLDPSLTTMPGYVQYEYIHGELRHMFALADLVISRAGANSICELLALHKPNILIPLSAAASRGDQILNARSFEQQGFSHVIQEEELSTTLLSAAITDVLCKKEDYIHKMEESGQRDSIEAIMTIINKVSKH